MLSEDKRFYEHSGVDWRAVAASAWGNLWNTRTRGASTLTMQLAGLWTTVWRARRQAQRGAESSARVTATQLGTRWSKGQILEAYLNSVPLRGDLVGVGAIALTLFDKRAHGWTTPKQPSLRRWCVRANAAPERVAQRACEVLKQQALSCDEPRP